VVGLLDRTLIRVGNEVYARANGSFGLTTLRDNHARVNGVALRLRFQGKSGKLRDVEFHDRRIARVVRQCQELPGQQLFQYQQEGGTFRPVESADVNRYLRSVAGREFSAKDFRTWKASALALALLYEEERQRSGPLAKTMARQTVSRVLREVAKALGNTVTVCRNYYVHPQIVDLFVRGKLVAACGRVPKARRGLHYFEEALSQLLQRLSRRRAHRLTAS
jgi:DNA topoisomerase-1